MPGRPANPEKSVVIRVTTTPTVKRYLERLVAEGLFGRTVGDAAERLITNKLNEMLGADRFSNVLSGDGGS